MSLRLQSPAGHTAGLWRTARLSPTRYPLGVVVPPDAWRQSPSLAQDGFRAAVPSRRSPSPTQSLTGYRTTRRGAGAAGYSCRLAFPLRARGWQQHASDSAFPLSCKNTLIRTVWHLREQDFIRAQYASFHPEVFSSIFKDAEVPFHSWTRNQQENRNTFS